MKKHTSGFKEGIKKLGKQQAVRITYTENNKIKVLDSEEINSVTPNYEANLLKSIMKGLDIDSNIDIPLGTQIKFEYGLLVNGAYEYLNYGNYIVYSSEKQEDTLSYSIKCYDKMLYAMKDYEALTLTYPCTIKDVLSALCNRIGLVLSDASFANQDRTVTQDLFVDQDYTYRDVLDQIAQIAGGCICLTLDDKIEIRYIKDTQDTIDEEYINDVNVNFGEKYGPINSVVLARAGESDKIYIKDDDSIEANGLCEIMISENQFMNFDDRDEYLQELSEELFGVEYYLNDFVSTGIMYYDLLDRYNVKIYDKKYKCVMFNDEQNITQGLEENIYTDRPDETKTDYTKADKTDRRINKTTLIVDKQSQQINALIQKTNNQEEKIISVTATVDGINTTISDYDETKNKVNEIVETVEGWTEKITSAGGNNIFKYDTDFWTGETSEDKPNIEEYTDDEIQQNSVSGVGYLANSGISKQIVEAKNDSYTIDLYYKKLKTNASGYITINSERIDLTSENITEITKTITVQNKNIDLEIYSDTDAAFIIYDIMGSIGTEKQVWTQNPNEVRTDTVQIGKGIQVNSSVMNTYTRIDADGNRTYNSNTNQIVMETTDKGITAARVETKVGQIGGVLIQKEDDQTWISSII